MRLFSVKKASRLMLMMSGVLWMAPVLAHSDGSHAAMGLSAGFSHPFSGIDHLLAMLAVGLWAAQNRRPALWALPLAFPVMMAAGAAAGMAGIQLSGTEMGIAGSVAVLGLLIAFAVKLPVWSGIALISLFALTHGFAHGAEMPSGASMLQYGAGFIVATGVLHLIGLAVGLAAGDKVALKAVRVAGAGIAATGVYLLAALA